MTTMVERMAGAMARETRPASKWHHIPEITQQAYLKAALAALRELREPTEVMRVAGNDDLWEKISRLADSEGVAFGEAFTAAIDAEIAAYEGKK